MLLGLADGKRGVNFARLEFQQPVAALGGTPGAIFRCGDIGQGEVAELADQAFSRFCLRQVAAINQNVAMLVERQAPVGNCQAVFRQGSGVEMRIPKLYIAVAAMGNNMDRIQVVPLLQRFGNLVDTATLVVQQDHFDMAAGIRILLNIIDQRLVILDFGINKNNLVAHRLDSNGIRGGGGRSG